jgi:hypothetical protein
MRVLQDCRIAELQEVKEVRKWKRRGREGSGREG